jgi:hypothetical protein
MSASQRPSSSRKYSIAKANAVVGEFGIDPSCNQFANCAADVRLQNGKIRGAEIHDMKTKGFAVCLQNQGYVASLEFGKLYAFLSDRDAEANDLIRAIDESGEDYLYPACAGSA